jgi:hypothetical protein
MTLRYNLVTITEFRCSWWFNVDVDSALGSSHRADVVSVADVSKVRSVSIFRIEKDVIPQDSNIQSVDGCT